MSASSPLPPPKPERVYSATNVIASAKTLNLSEIPSIYYGILTSPCFKTAFLWGGLVGALFAGHRFKQGMQAGDAARTTALRVFRDVSLSFTCTFGVQWYLCRVDEIDKRLSVREFYAARERAAPLPPPLPHGGGDEPAPGGADGDGPDAAWRRELERLAAYELPEVEEGPAESVRLR